MHWIKVQQCIVNYLNYNGLVVSMLNATLRCMRQILYKEKNLPIGSITSNKVVSLLQIPPYRRAQQLSQCLHDTLHKEAEIDAKEQIPMPIIPSGWNSYHKPGTNYALLHKNVYYYKSNPSVANGSHTDSTVFKLAKASQATSPFISEEERIRLRSSNSNPSDSIRNLSSDAEPHDVYCNSVTIMCPFHVVDPSFYHSPIDICEWQPFDVRVIKYKVSTNELSSQDFNASIDRLPKKFTPTYIMVQMANANSSIKLRHMQVLPYQHHSVFLSPAHELEYIYNGSSDNSLVPRGISWGHSDILYREQMVYQGPVFGPDFTKVTKQMIMEWITIHLEVTAHLVEYISQFIYYTEHQEYLRWISTIGQSL